MRVLLVTQYFWPERFRINDLAEGLAGLGHELVVLTGKPNYPEGRFADGYGFLRGPRERWGTINVVRAPLVSRGQGRGLRLALNYLSFALFASVVGPFACRGRFDAILVYQPSPVTVGIPALVMKALKRAPVLFWVQDLWPESLAATGAIRSPPLLRLAAWGVKRIYAGCARILVQSEAFVAPVRALGVPAERIVYYPNSAEDFYRPLARTEARPPVELPQGFRVVFAGNVGAAQGFETILDAAERLREHRNIHWLVLGEGRRLEWVREQVARRGLGASVHLLGQHPAEAMPVWFAHADAMLVSLRADPIFALTIPAKVQSYMACGRPIVASLDGEGARVVSEAGAGVAAPADDAAALARRVLELYRMSASEREAMGARGRAYFERRFERGMLVKRLATLMEEAARERAACGS
jgi:glycosyltransferase involved in cell wall biosynthesis